MIKKKNNKKNVEKMFGSDKYQLFFKLDNLVKYKVNITNIIIQFPTKIK